MSGSFRKLGARCSFVPSAFARCRAGRGVVLSMLLLGAGCGENVLVGNLQLRSLNDAGADISGAVEADAGINLQGQYADEARAKAEHKQKNDNRSEDKRH